MSTKFVNIVNPATGRKGRVAAGSRAAAAYANPPSERGSDDIPAAPPETPVNLRPELVKPAGNASTEEWRTYATDDRNPNALSSDRAAEMGRDELADHYKSEED